MWFRHGVENWHLDCQIIAGKHDFIASISRHGEIYELTINSSSTKTFSSRDSLNKYLRNLDLEEIDLP